MSERIFLSLARAIVLKRRESRFSPILLQTESIVSTFYACTAIAVAVQNQMHDLDIEELDLVKLHIL